MPPKQPAHVVCYICGRLYGTSSVSIHVPKCLEKWKAENSQQPRHLRRPAPKAPQGWGMRGLSGNAGERGLQLEAMNRIAFQSSQKQLVSCEFCGRTFNPERLAVHQRSCRPNNTSKPSKHFDPSKPGSPGSRRYRTPSPTQPLKPRTVVCYICGREFGTKSIAIHEPQCLKKWEIENSRLPRNMRRPYPIKPQILPSLGSNGGMDLERMNQLALESSQGQLLPCPNCGRTFLPDRLEVHLRSCRPSSKGTRLSPRNSSPNLRGQHGSHGTGILKEGTFTYERASSRSPGSGNETRQKLSQSQPIRKMPSKRPSAKSFTRKTSQSRHPPARLSPLSNQNSPRALPNQQQFGTHRAQAQTGQYSSPATLVTDGPDKYTDQGGVSLVPCSNCGRKFAADRISKHTTICVKSGKKQHKVFDSSKARTQGTENASFVRNKRPEPAKPKTNWRSQHQEFIRAIRDAKKVQQHLDKGGKLSDLPPPPPSENPDYVLCRFCQRRFNPTVAERHIPKCQTTINRPAPPKQRAIPLGGRSTGEINVKTQGSSSASFSRGAMMRKYR